MRITNLGVARFTNLLTFGEDNAYAAERLRVRLTARYGGTLPQNIARHLRAAIRAGKAYSKSAGALKRAVA